VLTSLRQAVERVPDDLALRLHLAEMLLDHDLTGEAVEHVAAALHQNPASAPARALMARALGTPASPEPPVTAELPVVDDESTAAGDDEDERVAAAGEEDDEFDWRQAEEQVADVVPPRFVEVGTDGPVPVDPADVGIRPERPAVRLADVGGLEAVKQRLDAAFLAPLRNPELRRLFAKSLGGGLLLYGPPGCGKTFLARAVAGELGAGFLAVSLTDVLDMYLGQSERNLHQLFELARREAPCVMFLDEVDAIGQRRSQLRASGLRTTVNTLLEELDGVEADNEGVFVLAATNAPWDVDPALRRPGRLDRMLLVEPPDAEARQAILRYHLRDRPVAGVDLGDLVRRTEDFTGADLAHLCETAAEKALLDSARTGEVRMIGMADLAAGLREVRPSTGPWFESARNVALFADEGGQYDDLVAYMKRRRMI
jgi:AAA+ superfamily predicted ATPase